MIPPFLRRCPHCGHVGASRRFRVVTSGGRRFVRCPVCDHEFEPIDAPWLQ